MHSILCFLLTAGMALPAFAQREKLIGTWEHVETDEDGLQLVMRIEFKDNGEFALNFGTTVPAAESLGAGEEGEEGAELASQILSAIFPDTLAIAVTATGTWEVEGQTLRVDAAASQVTINGLGTQEFFLQLGRELARRMAEAFEVTEADYPAFEQQVLEDFYSGAGAGLSEGFAPDDLDLEGTYALTEGVLYITDEVGETTDWHPSAVSAVEALSWGRLKAAFR